MIFIKVIPTGNNPTNKVADLTLNYRVPGSGQIMTQTVTLQYPTDGSETVDAPYLSAPEMAKRYAMYNLFLGLRDATQQTTYPSCALATLTALETHAVAWNATREDPDIADDISLIDKFQANLSAVGAYPGLTPGNCQYNGGGYEGGDAGFDQQPTGYGNDEFRGCSVGAAPGWLALVGLAFVAVRRRRRR